MSSSVISEGREVEELLPPPAMPGSVFGVDQCGVGMLEFLIALMIFSTGVMGLLSVQLASMKAVHEANQRSVATTLARDILERIQANPINAAAYVVRNVGDASRPVPVPVADCDDADCSTVQLAAFDLWQWETLLLGAAVKHRGLNVGGLRSPLACISHQQGVVDVVISWRGGSSASQSPALDCVGSGPGADVEREGKNNAGRHQLQLSTYVAGG
jgi:type IV pilus assembly protein PilV